MLLSRSGQQDRGEAGIDLAQNQAGHCVPGFATAKICGARGNDYQPLVCGIERRAEGMFLELNQNGRKEDPGAHRS